MQLSIFKYIILYRAVKELGNTLPRNANIEQPIKYFNNLLGQQYNLLDQRSVCVEALKCVCVCAKEGGIAHE